MFAAPLSLIYGITIIIMNNEILWNVLFSNLILYTHKSKKYYLKPKNLVLVPDASVRFHASDPGNTGRARLAGVCDRRVAARVGSTPQFPRNFPTLFLSSFEYRMFLATRFDSLFS